MYQRISQKYTVAKKDKKELPELKNLCAKLFGKKRLMLRNIPTYMKLLNIHNDGRKNKTVSAELKKYSEIKKIKTDKQIARLIEILEHIVTNGKRAPGKKKEIFVNSETESAFETENSKTESASETENSEIEDYSTDSVESDETETHEFKEHKKQLAQYKNSIEFVKEMCNNQRNHKWYKEYRTILEKTFDIMHSFYTIHKEYLQYESKLRNPELLKQIEEGELRPLQPIPPLTQFEIIEFKEGLRLIGILFNCLVNKSTDDLFQSTSKTNINRIHRQLNVSEHKQRRLNGKYKNNEFENELQQMMFNNSIHDVIKELLQLETWFKLWLEYVGIVKELDTEK